MNHKVLLVDDEWAVADVLQRYLVLEGFEVAVAVDGRQALALVCEWCPDLMILDLKLPSIDGIEVCRRVRQQSWLPIIMLTSRTEEVDRVVGLEVGADDYVVKPFSPRELVARVKAVLRRVSIDPMRDPIGTLRLDGFSINPHTRNVTVKGKEIPLTPKEFDLLFHLVSNHGQVFTRSQLMDQVWDYHFAGDASTVTVHIRRLREKIEANPMKPRYIKTVWGVGYKFER